MSTSDESGDNNVEDGDDSPDLDPLGKQKGVNISTTGKKRTRSDVSIQGAGTSAGTSAKSERTPSTGSKGKERRIGTRKSPRIAMKHSGSSGRATDEMGNKKGSLRIRNKTQEEPGSTSVGTISKSGRSSRKDSKGKGRVSKRKTTGKKDNDGGGGSSSGRATDETGSLRSGRIRQKTGTNDGTSSKTGRSSGKDAKGEGKGTGKEGSGAGSSSGRATDEKGKKKGRSKTGSSSGRATDEKGKKKGSSKTGSSSGRATVTNEDAKGKGKMSDRHVSRDEKKKKDGSLRIGEKAQERGSGKEEGEKVARRKSLRMQASNGGEESPYTLGKRKRSQSPDKKPKLGEGSGSKKESKSKKEKK